MGRLHIDERYGTQGNATGKVRQVPQTTPAMAAGISDHVWTCEEMAALLD